MKMRLANPSELIDISGIKELSYIRMNAGTVTIGAATTTTRSRLRQISRRRSLPSPIAASVIGDPRSATKVRSADQWRTMTCSRLSAAVLALGATIKTKKRSISADDFFTGLFTTALEDGEIVTELSFPIRSERVQEFGNPASRYAIVGVSSRSLRPVFGSP